MTKKELVSGAVGAAAAVALLAGGHLAVAAATGEPGAVNAHPIAPPAAAAPPSFADLVARVAPAVVSVDIEGHASRQATALSEGGPFGGDDSDDGDPLGAFRRLFPQGQIPQQARPTPMRATGSGFFISADGYLVTNNHVVENADKITVRTSDDRTLTAHLIGRDPATDLAVIKVEGHNYPFVSFEDRAKPRVGDWVVAVGNPYNLGGTVTAGIVSALNRANVSGSSYVDYMQIDAPINRGNSGGPTFDLQGRVVGVNSAIFSSSGGSIGIGFDIPADVVASVSKQLIANGKVSRGYIGATIQDITPDIAESLGLPVHQGALVADVVPDGPSARAGVRSGDLVLKVNGHAVTSSGDLTRQVAMVKAGDPIQIEIRRDGRPQALTIRSGLRPSEEQLALNDGGDGGPLGERGGSASGGLGLMVAPHEGGGLTVERVSPASDAGQKGVRPGDVIEQVGGKKANSVADVSAAIKAAKEAGHKQVLLLVTHNGRHVYLPVEIEAAQG
ncbi:Do family serine endopeptidase [Phenylobacterium sp.]|uniref:Do family serine endopeptidase n=1 Tax=Phenylobacterium sp. TaxID=1871053 RepID=UPI002D0D718B|nr:Do family serine endopeptidase [Phenylobacterium sp.]HLZ73532.1 Do family serine endopeptidase [Phenylobacterium sp.]